MVVDDPRAVHVGAHGRCIERARDISLAAATTITALRHRALTAVDALSAVRKLWFEERDFCRRAGADAGRGF